MNLFATRAFSASASITTGMPTKLIAIVAGAVTIVIGTQTTMTKIVAPGAMVYGSDFSTRARQGPGR